MRPLLMALCGLLAVAIPGASAFGQDSRGGTVAGRVIDERTSRGLEGVNVFLSFTTMGSATDSNGEFVIEDVPPGRYELVASRVGFSVVSRNVSVPSGKVVPRQRISLRARTEALDAIEVSGELPRNWKKNLKRFEDAMLGKSANRKATSLLNPEILSFKDDGGVLTATADGPLEIVNNRTGYRMLLELTHFKWDPHLVRIQYSGKPFFQEIDSLESKPTDEYRRRTWNGSLRHLLHSIGAGTAHEEGFVIEHGDWVGGVDEIDRARAARSMMLVDESDITFGHNDGAYTLRFEKSLRVTYRRPRQGRIRGIPRDRRPAKQVSWIRMTGQQVEVDSDGGFLPVDGLEVSGYLYNSRVADLLPRSYTPNDP